MRRRYKIVLNVEVDDPEKPYPADGSYTHLNKIEGVARSLAWQYFPPGVKVTLDKIIDKGEVKEEENE